MTHYENRLTQLIEIVDQIEKFRFCGPSDDPDEQTAVTYGYKHLAKRFTSLAKRIQDTEIQEDVATLDLDIEDIYGVYDLHSDIQPLLNRVRELAQTPITWSSLQDNFVDESLIRQLRESHHPQYDLAKAVRFCEELNNSYKTGNYLATILLIRAFLNHIPPVFGQQTFLQVVSQSPKSRRELFAPLENIARDIADLHTHSQVRQREILPTKNQVEPFKANFEVLLQEIIVETVRAAASA